MNQSITRGVEALLFLSTKRSAGVTEISKALDINKSTAYRIMETFLKDNIVEKNPETSKYKIGPALLKISDNYYKNLNVANVARPHLEKLSNDVHESVHLCILVNDRAVVIDQVAAPGILMVNARIGATEPIHASSVGKCLLAFSLAARQEAMLQEVNYERFTDKTIGTEEEMRAEIAKIKRLGFAVDDGELSLDVKCLATPVFNNRGECKYAIGISGPITRIGEEKTAKIASELIRTANIISSELGFEKS